MEIQTRTLQKNSYVNGTLVHIMDGITRDQSEVIQLLTWFIYLRIKKNDKIPFEAKVW